MKDTLLEIFEKLKTSKPVFTGTLDYEGDRIVWKLANKYDPYKDLENPEEVVAKMMAANHNEYFDLSSKSLYKTNNSNTVIKNIFTTIKQAFIDASPLKNPQQSKLYKWLEFDIINSLERREGMIALFRYIWPHIDGNTCRFKNGSENPHAKNLVAILQKMKDKYER